MGWLQLAEVLELHRRPLEQSGGAGALALPRQSVAGADLYPGLIAKAAALGFSLVQNHPFVDGNKRIGDAALELTLVLNDLERTAGVDAAEAAALSVATGAMDRETFTQWVMDNHRPLPAG